MKMQIGTADEPAATGKALNALDYPTVSPGLGTGYWSLCGGISGLGWLCRTLNALDKDLSVLLPTERTLPDRSRSRFEFSYCWTWLSKLTE
ncbi:MAG: hypothetical protein ACXW4O_07620 [Candidatus Binatia bacterium]